jgi:formate/nitrite transporter
LTDTVPPDGEVFSADPFRSAVISFATKKQVTPEFHSIFLRGIGCNWLVCLACFLALQGRDMASKIIGIWLPIYAFVSLGFDHVVANMTFIPLAIWLDAPGISVGLYIWKGIIPTLLGNIVGGGLFVGTYYWYMYLLQNNPATLTGLRKAKAGESAGTITPRQDDVEANAGMVQRGEGKMGG